MARRGGCLINGCLGVLVLALVLVVGLMVSFWNSGREAEADARDQVTADVDATRARLARAAADGVLLDTEIERAVRSMGKTSRAIERRQGQVTVTARFIGMVNFGFGGRDASGCYRFDVGRTGADRTVGVRELPDKACLFPSGMTYREPAAVAEDISTELRTAVADGGPEGARSAEVWQTWGVELRDSEVRGGQLTALVQLSGVTGPQGGGCYEFKAAKSSVTAKRLKPEGCYGPIG
ncbi:hypothetical protein AB0H92_42515 [Streptomyces phaeochromogenes]|uniref:hypothetical protein n=1 Tax=Streptomyces phaeochromogenes TaxID=1923 RepID=UPI0033CC0E7A